MTDPRELDRYEAAYRDVFRHHDENVWMIEWYVEKVEAVLRRDGARSAISLGIGHGGVCTRLASLLGSTLERYTVVEGSGAILREFQGRSPSAPGLQFVHGLFEEFSPGQPVDAVEMGFVLEHVDDPVGLLRQYASYLAPRGTLFIGVPNALSLHRRLGVAAGLLADPFALNESDRQLGHKRYFDLDSLRRAVAEAGLVPRRTEGIYLKPLSTGQLQSLALPRNVLLAMFRVGEAYPELCNGIYLEAVLPPA